MKKQIKVACRANDNHRIFGFGKWRFTPEDYKFMFEHQYSVVHKDIKTNFVFAIYKDMEEFEKYNGKINEDDDDCMIVHDYDTTIIYTL